MDEASGPMEIAEDSELARLRQLVEELRQAVRARDDFIAIAAHELRNPMTPILGVAELALAAARKAEDCPPRVILLLERMQQLVQDYVGRATRLLDVSRIEAGNLRLHPAPTDLSALARSVAANYAAAAARRQSPVELDIDEGVCGIWDANAVEQIVENLLSNALKFGSGKPVTLRLRADAHRARLEVRDQGVGMQPEQQARIFGRFEQLVSQHQGEGFGVGLWIANQLATAMDGRISVASRPGEGSAFTLVLPLGFSEADGAA